ncbi:MAG: TlpA disulfide reductase family protein [Comamonadaceae bacterium]|nr:TlpA disulfide reductase family protein [Comamonadaceae bacterium]
MSAPSSTSDPVRPARTWRRAATLLCAALLAPLGAAADSAAAPIAPGWDFTLPTLEGDRFITASAQPGLLLVNFWGVECPPCLAELPLLQRLASSSSGWRVLLVATDPPAEARRALQRWRIQLPAARGGPGVPALMRAAGNARGALPFTVLLRDGAPCARHSGALDEASLPALLARCAPPLQ